MNSGLEAEILHYGSIASGWNRPGFNLDEVGSQLNIQFP